MAGLLGKALAGAGRGLAIAGQMGYGAKLTSDLETMRAEVTALRDQRLGVQEDARLNTKISAEKSEGVLNRQSQIDLTKEQGKAAAEVKRIDVAGDLAKEGRKVHVVDGVPYREQEDGSLKPMAKKGQKWTANADLGVLVEENTGETKPMGEGEGSGRVPKGTKDTDDRIKMYEKFVSEYLGADFLAKLDEKARPDYARLLTNGADQVRNNIHPEKAFRAQVEALDRLKAKVSTPEAGGRVQDLRKKFGF